MSGQTTSPAPRGRPREFDIDDAVERAMNVFWTNGYHATSLPDLLSAMKVSRGSLYSAFGDKHGLFLCALDRYIADALVRLDAELDARTAPLEGIRACLTGYVDRASAAPGRRGCLVTATAMELAAHDAEVESRIRRLFTAMEERLRQALARAQAAGDLADGVEPATAARLLLCLLGGLRVVGKVGPDRAASHAAVRTLVDRFAR